MTPGDDANRLAAEARARVLIDRDEIDLLTRLIIAAMPFDHHLSASQIDAALGLDPSRVLDAGLVPPPRRALEGP